MTELNIVIDTVLERFGCLNKSRDNSRNTVQGELTDAILEWHKKKTELTKLDEEEVYEELYSSHESWLKKDTNYTNILRHYAKAICSKFSPKVVRLPSVLDLAKTMHISQLEWTSGDWKLTHKEVRDDYLRVATDIHNLCKHSLEEQGIKGME